VFGDPITCYVEDPINSKIQALIEDDHVKKYAHSEENGEGLESSETTLPLCFASFKLLKQNVCDISSQKSSRHDGEYKEKSGLAGTYYLPLCFSSFLENREMTGEVGKSEESSIN